MLESRDLDRGVCDGFALHNFGRSGLLLPKVSQGVDSMRAGEGGGENISTSIEVGSLDVGTSCGEGVGSGFGRVASEGPDFEGVGVLEEL